MACANVGSNNLLITMAGEAQKCRWSTTYWCRCCQLQWKLSFWWYSASKGLDQNLALLSLLQECIKMRPSASMIKLSFYFQEQQLLTLRHRMILTDQTLSFWSNMKLKYNSLPLPSQGYYRCLEFKRWFYNSPVWGETRWRQGVEDVSVWHTHW